MTTSEQPLPNYSKYDTKVEVNIPPYIMFRFDKMMITHGKSAEKIILDLLHTYAETYDPKNTPF